MKTSEKIIAARDIIAMPQDRPIFDGGVVDWAISASPIGGGGHYYDFNAGGMLLGGDISLSGSGNTVTGFDPEELIYRWHRYFDRNRYLTQANLGYINTMGHCHAV